MNVYQFLRYDRDISFDINKIIAKEGVVSCFDLEDSIQDCRYAKSTIDLKARNRKILSSKLKECTDEKCGKLGIRINSADSPEMLKDMEALAGCKNLNTLFIPKVNQAYDIERFLSMSTEFDLTFNELIPVIETKTGMLNLDSILRHYSGFISSIAFGHCDYNFNNSIYPFFHQGSKEYWNWIARIITILKPYDVKLINSPLLELNNDALFENMLSLLDAYCEKQYGQITLTKKQTELCFARPAIKSETAFKLKNKHDLRIPKGYINQYINSFELNCYGKGFAIDETGTILSPQEYKSSKFRLNKESYPELNFTFVGGCFPVQGNIPFEDHFHQVLKREIELSRKIVFNVNIIRYERFKNCLEKIHVYRKRNPIDILALSIRPEPFLRLVKFYYRYTDPKTMTNKLSFNIPAITKSKAESIDLLQVNFTHTPIAFIEQTILKKTLIDFNYLIGNLIGNTQKALFEYMKFVNEIQHYCHENKIKLILLGPPIRNNTNGERFLSKRLERFMEKNFSTAEDDFISGTIQNHQSYFSREGIHANENYHMLIAGRFFEKMLHPIDDFLFRPEPSLAG